MRKIAFIALATVLGMAVPFAVTHAQTPAPDAHHPDAAQGMKPMMGPMMAGMMPKMMGEHSNMMMLHHTEGYLAFLKAELQITEAQSGPWTSYADAIRSVARKAHDAMPGMPGMAATWPDKLAANAKALTEQLDALKAMQPSVTALYAVLTPDQKKKADALGASAAKGMM